ncbi:MAG TPA: hypothetical protein VNY34_00895 [Solirubrobacteraceae bacterium]|jgi:hypothetical protein|nr:hypothetical protein [Solirubrobacteraceae bacterium]
MTTRAIITSQPDVACEVCERRLLRGEQPDIFLTAGRRRIVCELCAPRAVNEGWRRESDGDALTLPPPRPRRGRNLFERLRQVARPMSEPADDGEELAYEPDPAPYDPAPQPTYEPDPAPYEAELPSTQREAQPYDFLGGLEIVEDRPGTPAEGGAPARSAARFSGASAPPERGIEVFNSSEFPRRIAGIARSLGAPAVNVSQVEDTVGDTVSIVVAWELCWYRYEVDLDVEAPAARLAAQGTELEELARGERVGNTPVDELGLLSVGPAA